MAKIILVVNMHPSETAFAVPLAHYLKANLKKRGYEVEIVGVPPKKTILYHLQSAVKGGGEVTEHGWDFLSVNFVKDLAIENPKSYVFDLHCSEDYKMEVENTKPKKIKVANRSVIPYTAKGIAIKFGVYGPANLAIVEAPAIFKQSPDKLRLPKDKKWFGFSQIYNKWFLSDVDLSSTRKAGYLSDTIVRKIAHRIDNLVQTREGRYRKINPRLRIVRAKRRIKRRKRFRI